MQFIAVFLSLAGVAITLPSVMAQASSMRIVTQISDGQIQAPVPTYGPVPSISQDTMASASITSAVMPLGTTLTGNMGYSSSVNVGNASASSTSVVNIPNGGTPTVDTAAANSPTAQCNGITTVTMPITVTITQGGEAACPPGSPATPAAPSESESQPIAGTATASVPANTVSTGSPVSQEAPGPVSQSAMNPIVPASQGGATPPGQTVQGPTASANPDTPISTSNGALTGSSLATETGSTAFYSSPPSIVPSSDASSLSSFKGLAIICLAIAVGMQL